MDGPRHHLGGRCCGARGENPLLRGRAHHCEEACHDEGRSKPMERKTPTEKVSVGKIAPITRLTIVIRQIVISSTIDACTRMYRAKLCGRFLSRGKRERRFSTYQRCHKNCHFTLCNRQWPSVSRWYLAIRLGNPLAFVQACRGSSSRPRLVAMKAGQQLNDM